LASAQHAALLGFRTFILEDGVWSGNTEAANAALSLFRDAYGGTLTFDEL
jgi:nicotinamidase-related amidase